MHYPTLLTSVVLSLAFSGLSLLAAAQVTEPNLNAAKQPPAVARFIPAGYALLSATRGNLNLDAIDDMVLIVKKINEKETSNVNGHPEKRPLLLLIGQPGGTYQLAGRNNNTVYCVDCGGMMGDPFMGVTIKNGYFSVEHYGGSADRWTRIITYKYSPADKNWYLSRDGSDSFSSLDPEKVRTQVKTVKNFGKVPFTAFDIYKE